MIFFLVASLRGSLLLFIIWSFTHTQTGSTDKCLSVIILSSFLRCANVYFFLSFVLTVMCFVLAGLLAVCCFFVLLLLFVGYHLDEYDKNGMVIA